MKNFCYETGLQKLATIHREKLRSRKRKYVSYLQLLQELLGDPLMNNFGS